MRSICSSVKVYADSTKEHIKHLNKSVHNETDRHLLRRQTVNRSDLKSSILALMIVLGQQLAQAQNVVKVEDQGILDRVVVFAIQQEVEASSLKTRSDLCIGIGYGLMVNEKDVIFKLERIGLRLHPNSWCNQRLRGLSIAVIAPIRETSAATYELVLELGDLSPVGRGEHFATLLKRGTYVIHCDKGPEAQIISYRQTCCEKTN
jgi:hypothetical protein